MAKMKHLAYAVACTLAESEEAPEGTLFAGITSAGATLDDFYGVKAFLLEYGLATSHPGPVLRATDKLRLMFQAAREWMKRHEEEREKARRYN